MKNTILVIIVLLLSSACIVNKRGMIGEHVYYSTMSPDIIMEVAPDYKYTKGGVASMDHQYKNNMKGTCIYMDHEPPMANENNVDYYFPAEKWILDKFKGEKLLRKGKYKKFGQVWHYKDVLIPNDGSFDILLRDIGFFTELHDTFKLRYLIHINKFESSQVEKETETGKYDKIDQMFQGVEDDIKLYRYSSSNIKIH